MGMVKEGFELGPFVSFSLHQGPKSTKLRCSFWLVCLEMDGTGLDGFHFIYQGHVVVQKATYGTKTLTCNSLVVLFFQALYVYNILLATAIELLQTRQRILIEC